MLEGVRKGRDGERYEGPDEQDRRETEEDRMPREPEGVVPRVVQVSELHEQ